MLLPHLLAAEYFRVESSTHNKYSAHLPHSSDSTSKLPDFEDQLCHLPSKSVTSFSVAFARPASLDIHVKPKVRRHRQHRSRLSKGFSVKCLGLKLPKVSSNVPICHQFYHFYCSILRKFQHLIYFIDEYFARVSTIFYQIGLLSFSSPSFVKISLASNRLWMLSPKHEVHLALFPLHKRQ